MQKKEIILNQPFLKGQGNWIFAVTLLSAFAVQLLFSDFYISSFFNVGLSLSIIIFSLIQLKKRLGLLIFSFALVFFLVARPFIDILTDFRQFYPMHYSFDTAVRANAMIGISMVALVFGQLIYEGWLEAKEHRVTRNCGPGNRSGCHLFCCTFSHNLRKN